MDRRTHTGVYFILFINLQTGHWTGLTIEVVDFEEANASRQCFLCLPKYIEHEHEERNQTNQNFQFPSKTTTQQNYQWTDVDVIDLMF